MSVPVEVIEVVTQIEECEKELKILKGYLNDVVEQSLYNIPDEEERKKAAAHIYWFVPGANAEKVKRFLPGKIPTVSIAVICVKCGEKAEKILKSKSQLAQYRKPIAPPQFTCQSCKDRESRESALRWEAMKAEQAAYLEELRTMPYTQYLQTEHWQKVRKSALGRARYKCQLCKMGGELNVHHNTYENRGQEENSDVIVLCRNCHAHFHGK